MVKSYVKIVSFKMTKKSYTCRKLDIATNLIVDNHFFPNKPLKRSDVFIILHDLLESYKKPKLSPNNFLIERCNSIGHRYEQPVLYGVNPPNVNIKQGKLQKIQDNPPIYTMDLTAKISGGDPRTFTDYRGEEHSLSLFGAWKANCGCSIDITPKNEVPFSKVRWTAPDSYASLKNDTDQYKITTYLGDNLGSGS